MVGPGEVDDELQDEVKGECSEKYGPVAKCTIYEVTGSVPPEEAVRIFVQFQDAEDATKGTGYGIAFWKRLLRLISTFCVFDGSSYRLEWTVFGGRKVKAVYYDERRFERMDITSQ